jgi:predicted RNase H-like HicB family nuclease
MISDYLRVALQSAVYQELPEEGMVMGTIPLLPGVAAKGHTLLDCRSELVEVLEDWVFHRISRHLPVPEIAGVTVVNNARNDFELDFDSSP